MDRHAREYSRSHGLPRRECLYLSTSAFGTPEYAREVGLAETLGMGRFLHGGNSAMAIRVARRTLYAKLCKKAILVH